MRGCRGTGTRLWIVSIAGSALVGTGCQDGRGNGLMETTAHAARGPAQPAPGVAAPQAGLATGARPAAAAPLPARAAPACEDPIPHFEDGSLRGRLCADEARRRGLTIVDLSDTWTPVLFAPAPRDPGPAEDREDLIAAAPPAGAGDERRLTGAPDPGTPAVDVAGIAGPPESVPEDVPDAPDYRRLFLALANERFDEAGPDTELTRKDRFLELYGIFPTLSVLRARFAGDERHACHEAVDDAALAALDRTLREEKFSAGHQRVQTARGLRATLERERARRGHDTLEELAASDPYHRRQLARLVQLETTVQAIAAAEAHLACEGLLEARRVDGVFDWRTGEALRLFHRKHFVVATGQLTADSRAVLATGSRELDFRAALRVLRERVVDATGILEDGSARNQPEPILGRMLDPQIMYAVPGHEPLPDGAPDLVARATDAAARHLGWTDLDALRRFLDTHAAEAPVSLRVALALPPVPDYYGAHMELRVEIDRGDVWYDPAPRWRPVHRRPAVIVRVVAGAREIPLVRWPTTIGGWQKERLPSGAVVSRYKDSEVGPRVWRDLYAAPAWLPPPTTPDEELVRRNWDGTHSIRRDTLGPSYRSAYGLAMFIHHQIVNARGTQRFDDNGVRSHGSASYTSIVSGASHGCHRQFNHHALRLASFVLRHRSHRRHGEETVFYDRVVHSGGRHRISLRSRGYRYELTPPIPVMVTEGRIRSKRKKPWR